MSDIQFRVAGQPISFSHDDYAGLSSGNPHAIWDIFTKKSREIYREKAGEALGKSCELAQKGICLFESVITEGDILNIKSILGESPSIIEIQRGENAYGNDAYTGEDTYTVKLMVFNEILRKQINKLIYKVLNKKLVADLEAYFQSFFSINHIVLSRTFPDPDPIVSFRWHRDVGPKMQTHIMIYLDDSEATGGRTEFVDYQDSLELEKIYSTEISRRVTDLKQVYPAASIIRPAPKAGDALVFNATRIFHQGIHPNRGFRDVLFIILQPDFQPWSKSFPSERVFNFPSGTNLYGNHPFGPYAVRA